MTATETLGDEYPKEQMRLVELIKIYDELGPVGVFGKAMITDVLYRANQAVICGDRFNCTRK